jgi:hypothetical protein
MTTEATESTAELLTLHAVRLKGMADDGEVAARFGLDLNPVREALLDFQAFGWVTRVDFAGTGGWTLTSTGRAVNERQLAEERIAIDATASIQTTYATFQQHNGALLQACTNWQLRPSASDPLAINRHQDRRWDQRVLTELARLADELRTLSAQLGGQLVRFQGYDTRFATALGRAQAGDHSWVTQPKVDSCHTVWMELHEDFLATLGIERGGEPAGQP